MVYLLTMSRVHNGYCRLTLEKLRIFAPVAQYEVKVKVTPCQAYACIVERRRLQTHGRGTVSTTPRPLYPLERPGWVGLKAGLDGCGKSLPPPGFDPQTVQPVMSHNIK